MGKVIAVKGCKREQAASVENEADKYDATADCKSMDLQKISPWQAPGAFATALMSSRR
jgi:hypothetical protein